MLETILRQLGDKFWMNVRYSMIAGGTALLVNGTKGLVDAEHATAIMTPVADIAIGFLMAAVAWAWGNIVRWRTKTVPENLPVAEVVSPVTGDVTTTT